jgi:hypothetical protein
MFKRLALWVAVIALVGSFAVPVASAQEDADLGAIKAYALEKATAMKAGTEAFLAGAQDYYDLIDAAGDEPYAAVWADDPDGVSALIEQMRTDWLNASINYEQNEGIIAGVPSLAYYDTLLDAGPSAEEAPDEALSWSLVLPDGTELASPGNLFHHLSEPALYGTNPEFVALDADLNGNGEIGYTEALPDANLLLGIAQRLDDETGNMIAAVEAWEPTLEDAFTALLVMIPTMNEYFGQWRDSAFIEGNAAAEESFVAVSRLSDILSILTGLDLVYDSVSPVVAAQDAELDAQINAGFDDLITFVDDLFAQEQDGTAFAAEEVDFFGTEAQDKAETLAAQVAQAADLAGLMIVLD